jgi:hypothetical protein
MDDNAKLIRVAASEHAILNGVAVSPEGRVFSSFPRWMEGPTPCIGEAQPDGGFKIFPDNSWNEWRPGLSVGDHFVNVHSLHADPENFLWVVDDGAAHHQPYLPGAPKIVKIDLRNNQIVRIYPIDAAVAPPKAVLGHMRILGKHGFITESFHNAIIVLDLETGATRRVLHGLPQTQADTSVVPLIDGREFRRANGQVPTVHMDLLELSPDGRWLYFTSLFGPLLCRIETKYLIDAGLDDTALAAHVEEIARTPPCAGITIDRRGNIYFSAFSQNAILVMGEDRKLKTLASDPRISFPNECDIGPDDYLYFPASQIHRLPGFHADGKSTVKTPWEVLKVKTVA